jgi:hypothetical protein
LIYIKRFNNKAFSDATYLRKAAIRKRDVEEYFQSFVKSGRALEIMKMFDTMAADPQATADGSLS